MKRFHLLPSLPLLWALTLVLTFVRIQPAKAATNYNSLWEPLSASQTQQLVRRNAKNGDALYTDWGRAVLYGRMWDYIATLRQVQREQPNNPTVYAAYALVLNELAVQKMRDPKSLVVDSSIDATFAGVRKQVEKTKTISPHFWMVPMLESRLIPNEGNDYFGTQKVSLARQAVHIEGNALSYLTLSNAQWYHGAMVNDTKGITKVVATLERANRLFPGQPYILAELYSQYHYALKDETKAEKARTALLATIRPTLRRTAPVQKFLKQKGIVF